MVKMTKEFEKLKKENEKLRSRIEASLAFTSDSFRGLVWDLINNLINNEINQEELCGE